MIVDEGVLGHHALSAAATGWPALVVKAHH
jgi:hypothetical protein